MTMYQKLVLKLLCAILWQLVYKNSGYSTDAMTEITQKHRDLINETNIYINHN